MTKRTYRYDKDTDEMVEVRRIPGAGPMSAAVRCKSGRFVVWSQDPWGGGTAEQPSPDWPAYDTDPSSDSYGQPCITNTTQIPDVCAKTGLEYGVEGVEGR